MPPDYFSILSSIFRLPSLSILRVTMFQKFPISLLASIHHLRILDICHVQFNHEDYHITSTTIHYPRSHLLELHAESCDLKSLLIGTRKFPPAFDITNLKSLYVTAGYESRDMQAINTIFEVACASVTHLTLTLYQSFPEVNINVLHKLQTLCVLSEYFFSDSDDCLHGLTGHLAAGSTPFPNLNSISIDVCLDSLDGFSDSCFDSWPVLDRLLVTGQFPALQNVSLQLKISYNMMDANLYPEVLSNIQALQVVYFPLLSATKPKPKFHFAVEYC
ncbi:hypothetical protein HYPSUDRAFT_868531 [Hypholoma sublateritium FD-334 SS-4]|uniref:F-box domain-containing protein n=1 Tax=Hypholoma sublateritium (strain FD-334 SS-4) TaxID=945553 RepID=A0A0D2LJA0_HYPSF|nr:hypothetical protein HYPSUDRAFT_868531 [Hypholoma sublateritium FD-334 SS-4]